MARVLYRQEFEGGKTLTGYIPTSLNGAKALSGLFSSKVSFYEEVTNLSKNKNFTGVPAKAQIKFVSSESSKNVFVNILIDESKTDEDDIQAKLKNITIGGIKFDASDPKIFGGNN